MTQQRADAEQRNVALASDRDKLASAIQESERKRAQTEQEITKLTEDMAARNKQLAELEGKLQSTRQELSETQSKLGDVRQQVVPGAGLGQSGGPSTPGANPVPPPQ